jgi:hypothetical protein
VERDAFVSNALEASIRIGLVALLAFYSLQIIKPFVAPMLWGIIIAISTRPLYLRLELIADGRGTLAALPGPIQAARPNLTSRASIQWLGSPPKWYASEIPP